MDEMFENWAESKEALMEGLTADQSKIVAPLLENQKDYAINEAAAAGSTGAHDVAGFRKILIPMIRRIIPGTIAQELVGVQPMQGPVGLVYSLRFKYTDGIETVGAEGNIIAGAEMFGNDDPVREFYAGNSEDMPAGAGGIGPGGVAFPDNTVATGVPLDGDAHRSTQSALSGCTTGGSGSHAEGMGGRRGSLEVLSQAVEAGTRKLQAGWTIEAMQDMNSQHGLDIESEMTQALSAEIVQEIDAEIINDLIALAGTSAVWDYAASAGTTYAPAYIGDRFANLAVVINRVANEIGRKTRRGVGNFIVVSPMIVSVLQSAAKSVFAPAVEGSFKGPNNTMLVGTLNGQIKVYSYLWNQSQPSAAANNDTILVGYKGGNGETDTGYFYCPYIPLMSSGVVVNPITFQPVVSLMTRYGKTDFTNTASSLGNSADYYGKIQVDNLVFA